MRNLPCFCLIFGLFTGIMMVSCKTNNETAKVSLDEHELLNEDSIELADTYQWQAEIKNAVYPRVETEPVMADSDDDAADDPAIWYNRSTPDQSIIFGSNKKGGLVASDLSGKTINYYEIGKVNNVDVLYDYKYQDSMVSILGCSNRTTQAVNLFVIEASGNLVQLNHESFTMDTSRIDDIYGFCFGRDKSNGKDYVFVNGKNGLLIQYEILNEKNTVSLKKVRQVQFDSQTEGMVVDENSGRLFVGEEDAGVWMLDVAPDSDTQTFLDLSNEENPMIKFDIEGLTVLDQDSISWLIVSSQGNFTYAVFDLDQDNDYLTSFKIVGTDEIDGVEETDGIAVIGDSLSTKFPAGIFVAQDGFNYQKDSITAQNFKYVDVRDIISSLKTK